MLKRLIPAIAVASTLLASAAHATIVNIDAVGDPTPGSSAAEYKSVALLLDPGIYDVTPVNSLTTPGADFIAANRFSATASCDAAGENCRQGWEHSYYVKIGAGGTQTKYGMGEGIPTTPPAYFQNSLLAFDYAEASTFTLLVQETVYFSWLDDNWGDNIGGISLSVTAVPEPSSLVLVLASLAMVGVIMRRRIKR